MGHQYVLLTSHSYFTVITNKFQTMHLQSSAALHNTGLATIYLHITKHYSNSALWLHFVFQMQRLERSAAKTPCNKHSLVS